MVITRASKSGDDGSRKRKYTNVEKKLNAKKVKGSSSKHAYQLEDENIGLNPLEEEKIPRRFLLKSRCKSMKWYMIQVLLRLT